eukprot:g10921.t1
MQPCDPSSAFFGFMGVTSALVFANLGAAYGTAKKSIIPVVMAGVLGIYGLITAVIINGKMDAANYSAYSGYAHLGAGLTVGMSSLAAGLAIGIVGDAGVRANAQQPRLFVGPDVRATDVLFDKGWRERHRQGENDYAKTYISEPFAERAKRFVLRSIAGALAGLGLHALATRIWGKGEKTE